MAQMTFDGVRDKLMSFLSQQKLLESTLKAFSELNNDNERLIVAYSLLKQSKLLPSVEPVYCKTNELSNKSRALGNELFCNQRDIEAIKQYTLAVGQGTENSKELALAFANRSAVTYSLGEYEDCIKDIELALKGQYPTHLRYKLFERKGKACFQLRQYAEAAAAFQESINYLGKSNLMEEKLEKIKKELNIYILQCKKNNQSPKKKMNSSTLPSLEQNASTYIECGSSLIDIKYNHHMGRHIVAACDINPGDILAIEPPFVSVLLPSSYTTHCFFCLKRSHSLLPCLFCAKVFFCSLECQNHCWEQSHSIECSLLPALLSIGCNKMELLAVKTLLKATQNGAQLVNLAWNLKDLESSENLEFKGFKCGKYLSTDYVSTHNLEGNTELRKPCDLLGRAIVASWIIETIEACSEFFSYTERQPLEETKISILLPIFDSVKKSKNVNLSWQKIVAGGLILRYLQSMPCNAHEVSEMFVVHKGEEVEVESNEIGGAVYPLLSLINHSCDPNVVRHSYGGDTVVLTAIQVIKAGEQIYDNYGFHHAVHGFFNRQEHLQSQYYFKCECVACTEDWPLYVKLPDTSPMYFVSSNIADVEESSKKFRETLKDILSGNTVGKLPFLYNHLRLLHKSISRPWKEYSECQEAIKQCLSLQANHYIVKNKS